ncbi:MAG: DegT/DnrJ/EryC1/StrS family aminotransferase [Deltaproteobacteria bacterium]|nr:DegT/DnrJ/EryC1/StrS family aminotransferase [Deltaproteobacteria bacterium]
MSGAPVPQLDLVAQYETIAGEIEPAVLEVLRSGRWVLGEHVQAFEAAAARYVGVPHAIGCASGSDALLLALMALDVRPGDEVVTTAFSFFATASAITRLGARPVFADIRADDFLLDPDAVRAVITPRTRALLPVHLYGQCVDFAAFAAIAAEHRLPIVEDAAQAFGATRDGTAAGAGGDLGCFSFYPTKNLGAAGDAGLLSARDDRLAARVRRLREHGSERRYEHVEVGLNSRLDAIQAAILRVKLAHVDAWSDARAARAATYANLFRAARLDGTVALPSVRAGARHIFHQYVIRTPRRDALRDHLRARQIGCEVYYPIPLHLQQCFAELGGRPGSLPETERASREVLALPMYPELTQAQQERVVDEVASFFR